MNDMHELANEASRYLSIGNDSEHFSFMRFTGKNTPPPIAPSFRVGKIQIHINASAWRKYNLENYLFACLYWDKDHTAIGVRFCNSEEPNSVKLVRQTTNKKGGAFPIKSFCNQFALDIRNYLGFYQPKVIESSEGIIYVIELKQFVDDRKFR